MNGRIFRLRDFDEPGKNPVLQDQSCHAGKAILNWLADSHVGWVSPTAPMKVENFASLLVGGAHPATDAFCFSVQFKTQNSKLPSLARCLPYSIVAGK
jgi:hypothetical protein